MIVLGIDPGSRKTGYAVVEHNGRKFELRNSGVFSYEKEGEFINRLGCIYDSMMKLTKTYCPYHIALESLIHVRNIAGLAKLSQARGAMLAAFMKSHRKKVFEYAPNMVKQAVTGHGHASKKEVEKALELLFGKVHSFQTHDESDALAVAVCHIVVGGEKKGNKRQGKRTLREAFKHLG